MTQTTHAVIRRDPTSGTWWWVCVADRCTHPFGEGHGLHYPTVTDAIDAVVDHMKEAAAAVPS